MVYLITTHYYSCICEKCGKIKHVEKDLTKNIYNGAQAVRSLGWSFGKDGKTVKCDACRNYRFNSNKI